MKNNQLIHLGEMPAVRGWFAPVGGVSTHLVYT